MLGSLLVYSGLVFAVAGLMFLVRPIRRLGFPTRPRAMLLGAAGVLLSAVGFALPAPVSRIRHVESRLDEWTPAWQFEEFHSLRIDAPPDSVFDAILRVRADEIALFRTLTWIRRGGRPLPRSILDAGHESLIDLATRSSFVRLVQDAPRELVIGTVVMAPPGTRGTLSAEVFRKRLPPGFALATMNFVVKPEGGRSRVTTETRVFANSAEATRRFAAYWRIIYPGSSIIRAMWLRAIQKRATGADRL